MLISAIQQIDLVAQAANAYLYKVMIDHPMHISLSDFAARQPVTVQAVYTPEGGVWKARAMFLTDDNGCVDVATQAPLSGSYHDADAMGLFWSMERDTSEESSHDNRVTLTAWQSEQRQAVVTIERLLVAPGVMRQRVREQGLYGTLMLPPGEGPHPGMLVLGGSGGGIEAAAFAAQLFASHGYAALALAYFHYEGLPMKLHSIPLEYFETAIQWMQAHKSIQKDHIGVYGRSRGGELALLLGATFSSLKTVVALVPGAIVFQGMSGTEGTGIVSQGMSETRGPESHSSWSFHGQDLPYVPIRFTAESGQAMRQAMQEHTAFALSPSILHSLEHADAETIAQATIPVEKIQGPVLLVSGQDDQMWPSSLLSDMVIKRLVQHQFSHAYKHLAYPDAGHQITFPYQPAINAGDQGPFTFAMGGKAQSQAAANQDSWTQILAFLARTLSHENSNI
ncbi:MAG: acyl-CoA thioesterase/bile acid-CoA:amino acid N-acyltransferase family protein [Ktedonobacteraceae bacterium]